MGIIRVGIMYFTIFLGKSQISAIPPNNFQEFFGLSLYSGNQIVVFYGSNSWAYTRLGNITNKTAAEIAELLGNGNVTITISME